MSKRVLLIVLLAAPLVMASSMAQSSDVDPHQTVASSADLLARSAPTAPGALAGNECSVASATGDVWPASAGDHFHSDDAGSYDNPPDLAETGGFSGMGELEEVRGIAEFDLSGQGTMPSAMLTFTVLQLGGLFGQEPSTFDVEVLIFDGNNIEDITDFTASVTFTVGTFNTAGLEVDETLDFDITDAYNSAVSRSVPALGIRLQASTDPGNGAFVFGEFELAPGGVPTTPPWGLMVLFATVAGLGVFLLARQNTRPLPLG